MSKSYSDADCITLGGSGNSKGNGDCCDNGDGNSKGNGDGKDGGNGGNRGRRLVPPPSWMRTSRTIPDN